jgi:hypothetical protein
MSEEQTRIEVNCTTGVVTEHVLTAQEIAERDQQAAAYAEEQAIREAAEAAKAVAKASANTKLAALGLTTEEIAAL